jgi:hypothetical protein
MYLQYIWVLSMSEYIGLWLAAVGVESVDCGVCNRTLSVVNKVTTSDEGSGLTVWAYRWSLRPCFTSHMYVISFCSVLELTCIRDTQHILLIMWPWECPVHDKRCTTPVLLRIVVDPPLYLVPRVVPWFDLSSCTILALQVMCLAVIL